MNSNTKIIFIIGPGGAGKTTTGKILAKKINYTFIDLDQSFNQQYEPIPLFVKNNGYKIYCETNLKLLKNIVNDSPTKSVISLPSGFMIHEDFPELVIKQKNFVIEKGITVMLLPSKSITLATEIIVERQLTRGFTDINDENERKAIIRRHPLYSKLGDIQILSADSPEQIANKIIKRLGNVKEVI